MTGDLATPGDGTRTYRGVARSRPVSRVLAAIEAGRRVPVDIARETGLPLDVVRASVEHLIRLGRVENLDTSGCSVRGCGDCPALSGTGQGVSPDCDRQPVPGADGRTSKVARRTFPGPT